MWKYVVLVSIVIVIGLITLNIRSLVRKIKANKKSWFDLGVGIFISLLAIAGLIYIFIQQL